ncbi:hypothetical protein DRQ53_05730 [bacterium]|nr:MAG: hypothetical protein DRQ53_05730 [bacterium]
MSYLRRLDQARALLGEGRLLAAEHELREATAEWKSSRLRVPLVEKGVEPALRALGRVFGRKSDEPVLPVFSRGARLLREDLLAFARSLAAELLEELEYGDLAPRRRHELATEVLELQRSSEFFAIRPGREWEVVRLWLSDARSLDLPVSAELLPRGQVPAEDRQWWLQWLQDWCASPVEPFRAFAEWARSLAGHYAELSIADAVDNEPARWAWVQARLALLDPVAAPHAVAAVARVLELTTDQTLRREALLSWAELVTNSHLLACPGGNARDLLDERSMDAARLQLQWPPAAVAARVAERRPLGDAPVLVSVRWHDDATAIAFVLNDGRREADVLCLKPSAEAVADDPFVMDDARAQRRIAGWMPPGAILLSAREPGPRMRSLVGSARWIPVDSMRELLGVGGEERAARVSQAGHPAFGREICAPWDALVPEARRLLPQLESLLQAWPSMLSLCGRENLRRIGSNGLPLAEALADAADLFPTPMNPPDLVETAPPLRLVWPSLAQRPWPAQMAAALTPRVTESTPTEGRVWIDRKASPGELAAAANAAGPANLLCVGEARALELADAAARAGDPTRVALVGATVPCLGPLLELLNRWLNESPGDLQRGRAAVWLLALLSEQAGSLEPLLERCGDAELVQEVRAQLHECEPGRTCSGEAPCWPEQAVERVRRSAVAVVDLSLDPPIPEGRRTIADDLRSWVSHTDDLEAEHRLAAISSGNSSVIYTPGVGFMPALLGAMPIDGPDDWRFVASAGEDPVAVWAVPPGYGASSSVLAREARALLEERARRWIADVGEASLWGEDLPELSATLDGVASAPGTETVLVGSLGQSSLCSPLLAGLRLAAAASHARRRVVCLSPAFAELFEHSGGLLFGKDLESMPRALDSGSALLAARRGRPGSSWVSPLTRPRLESAGASNPRELATALTRWSAGRGRVLAGATESDRLAVLELLRRLQLESLDGGPLGVRSLVIVSAVQPVDLPEGRAESRLRTLERGREVVARLDMSELADPAVVDWARRNPAVVWLFRDAEFLLQAAMRAAGQSFLTALRRSQARALFFTDHLSTAQAVRDLVVAQLPLEPVYPVSEIEPGLDPAGWQLRTLGALDTNCPDCSRPVVYRAAFELCPNCGIPVDAVAPVRRALRLGFESRVIQALRQLGAQATWTLVVFDPGRRSRLRQRLGLSAASGGKTPLLEAMESGCQAEVIVCDELWREETIHGPVIICGLPASVQDWEVLAGRLAARELDPGQWWLAPPGLDETEPLPAAETEFRITREEFLEQWGEPAGAVAAKAVLRRMEAAGGGWSSPASLRVHELVSDGQLDDAPLAALASAGRSGWVEEGMVQGMSVAVPAALERAVRAGQRLRPGDDAVQSQDEPANGRIVGVGGFGKTAALVEAARQARSQGREVLVLVPSATGRLEWVERLGDPSVSCLDFDEFLLEFVAACARQGPSTLRVLPPRDRRHGEKVRLELVRVVSELYAASLGELPAVDGRSITRALEGERLGVDPYDRDPVVDYDLLQRCVHEARREGGWTDTRELLASARAHCASQAEKVRAWAEPFDLVLVDDAHDLPHSGLEFIREIFASRLGPIGHDPVLGPLPEGEVDSSAMHSARFGPAIAEAIERVWRSTTPLPARVRGRRGLRSTVDSERVLALSAAVERIADELLDSGAGPEVALVAAHERDRRSIEQQLSVRGIAVDGLDADYAELVSGPREILAALAWVSGAKGDHGVELLSVILAAGPEPDARRDAAHYEARLRRRLEQESVEVLDRVEAFLVPLVLIRGALGPDTKLERAVEVLLDCGLFEQLRSKPGVAKRIESFVRRYRELTVAELLETVSTGRILRPSTGGSEPALLAPDQLPGRSFDSIYYICTGFESPERHYRVFSRARRAVRIACSEVDPLQG